MEGKASLNEEQARAVHNVLCCSMCLQNTATTPRQTRNIRVDSAYVGTCSPALKRAGGLPAGITELTTVWLLPFTAIVKSALSMLRPTARVSMFTPAAHAWLTLRCRRTVCHSH